MPPATRSSSMELGRPSLPPKCQRGSLFLPLPDRGSRMAPPWRAACRLMRVTVDVEVSQRFATVTSRMPDLSMFSATLALERSTASLEAIDR